MSELSLPHVGTELAHRLHRPELVIDVFVEDHTVPTPAPPVNAPGCCVYFVPSVHTLAHGAAVPAQYRYDQPYPFPACSHPQRTNLESGCSPCVYPHHEAMVHECSYASAEPWVTICAVQHMTGAECRALQHRRNTEARWEYRLVSWDDPRSPTERAQGWTIPDTAHVEYLGLADYGPETLEQAVADLKQDLMRPDGWEPLAPVASTYFGAFA